MARRSLKQRILKHLQRHGGWVNGAEYERLADQAGYKGSNASRRLRELENDGKIIRKDVKGKYATSVWYKSNRRYITVPYRLENGDVINRRELRQINQPVEPDRQGV